MMSYSIPRRSAALRRGRCSIPGRIYSITTVTRDRVPFFHDFYRARCVVTVLREHEINADAETLAYVVMPDHIHWLMRLGARKDLSTTVQSVKSICSKRCGQRLWQRGFYDSMIRNDDHCLRVARYIVRNPVRAKLAQNIWQYPHWDAIWI